MKRIIYLSILIFCLSILSVNAANFDWAKDAVDYCVENEILHGMENGDLALGNNITNEQTAKILVSTFQNEKLNNNETTDDEPVVETRWSAPYVRIFNLFSKYEITDKDQEQLTTREEFVASLVLASGLKESNIRNRDILSFNFKDYKDVSNDYTKLMCIAAERGYMKGSDFYLNPKDNITRAEACSLIYRVIRAEKKGEKLDLGVIPSETKLIAESKVSVEQAKAWAKQRGAADRFIEIADVYWKYGEITGICPELLYAQAAKETKFGLYGGNVIPEQNNWAGIKIATSNGDSTYDHESFETPDDGVRGHFNHMGAYVGIKPVGEPHGRYNSVSKMPWAGTVETLEQLGGKWCPDLYYGYSILHNYIEPMMNTKI